ncbi:uncharacterized protein EDB93DRAFT_1324475 [Suillus bovinus]|uniref:uncharacterized protein n=1 Tax=Suillus bovinus TaxID=48563 RepID=UPI001B8734A6|nr:uncharacterized protein EDB93DRAFT_1324475 [Suillus bovinus]KAG2159988.1 hypothetical protein EDB93DRAFT_1324475 [Suillus bovinus]
MTLRERLSATSRILYGRKISLHFWTASMTLASCTTFRYYPCDSLTLSLPMYTKHMLDICAKTPFRLVQIDIEWIIRRL